MNICKGNNAIRQRNVEINAAKRVHYWLKCVDAAALLVIFLALATCTNFAQNSMSSESAKLNALRERAEQGDSKAASDLGWMYLHRPEADYAEALRWYHKAAEAGDVVARHALGDMYFHGQGVNKDYAEAARWYGCPKPDDKILSSCAEGIQEPLPPEARKAFRRVRWCNVNDDGYGTAIGLSEDRKPVYSSCCHEYAHGECEEVLIGKVAGVWKDIDGGYGFWNCHDLLPLPSVHAGFHDVCHPNVCSPGTGFGNKSCIPDIQVFSNGRYHSASATKADGAPQ
ncbi:MAG TPA: tetratricopeptide repeat protein [Terriglobales bacterium]|nr:tetratricopeptide repeat protein [Terriglobales bacterium]